MKSGENTQSVSYPDPKEAITDPKLFGLSIGIFAIAVVLLITHANTGLTVAFIGVFVAILTLIVHHREIPDLMQKVDYKTLLFFIGLFVVVS